VKEDKEAIPEMEIRVQEAEAIMQGKGYEKPHPGMSAQEGDHPKGANPHDTRFVKHHSGGANTCPHSKNNKKDQQSKDQNKTEFDSPELGFAAEEEREMGDEKEESAGNLGRDRTDDL
jgi:protein disulfide-isomerase A6